MVSQSAPGDMPVLYPIRWLLDAHSCIRADPLIYVSELRLVFVRLAFKRAVPIIHLILGVCVSVAAWSNYATAMDFSTKQAPDGDRFVLAKGEIVDGDAERLRIALQSVGRNRYGNKEMALESGGGLVAEALKMVAVMDEEKVSTVVLPGALCASACAQIVFLAGVHRVVADGGRLGFHTCAAGRTKSPLCNEIIAQNALEHGTDYGSVMAFMKYTGPSEMIWFGSKDADCYGFTRWPPGVNRGKQPGEIAPCVRDAIVSAGQRSPTVADQIALLCSGTVQAVEFHGPVMPTKETIVVDYGSRLVTGPLGSYPLTSLTETKIEFLQAYVAKGNSPMVMDGQIDRVSGETRIIVRRQDQPQGISVFYALNCQPARRAF
jgi:hypothetical protein